MGSPLQKSERLLEHCYFVLCDARLLSKPGRLKQQKTKTWFKLGLLYIVKIIDVHCTRIKQFIHGGKPEKKCLQIELTENLEKEVNSSKIKYTLFCHVKFTI